LTILTVFNTVFNTRFLSVCLFNPLNLYYTLIFLLLLDSPMYVGDLANKIGLSISRTSRLVDMLVNVGLVETKYYTFKDKKGVFRLVKRTANKFTVSF